MLIYIQQWFAGLFLGIRITVSDAMLLAELNYFICSQMTIMT